MLRGITSGELPYPREIGGGEGEEESWGKLYCLPRPSRLIRGGKKRRDASLGKQSLFYFIYFSVRPGGKLITDGDSGEERGTRTSLGGGQKGKEEEEEEEEEAAGKDNSWLGH